MIEPFVIFLVTIDGFVKSEAPRPQGGACGSTPGPTAALRGVPYVGPIPQDLRALPLKLFTVPSNIYFLRLHHF